MAEASPKDEFATKAPKDKNCQFCGQAFTSSSLGRHLDLYIREKNPKPSDGIHDVDAIREIRGNITRRQPRNVSNRNIPGSLASQRSGEGSPGADDAIGHLPNSQASDGPSAKTGPDGTHIMTPASSGNRTVSRQVAHKMQLESRQRMAVTLDTAKATDLALREIISLLKAAKYSQSSSSKPFDFNPLEFDFPSLTLQCLKPPPTLFSSTQHPTSTSWSVNPPDQREYDALVSFFAEEFRKWRIKCSATTSQLSQELTLVSANNTALKEARDAAMMAEKSVDTLSRQINDHLLSSYNVWQGLSNERKQEVWILELARGIGRKNKEAESLKEQNLRLTQEVVMLKAQVESITKANMPKEYTLSPPMATPLDPELAPYLLELANKNNRSVLSHITADEDVSTILSKSIERWKTVVQATRAAANGMNAQRPLDGSGPPLTPTGNNMAPAIKTPQSRQSKSRSASKATSQRQASAMQQLQQQQQQATTQKKQQPAQNQTQQPQTTGPKASAEQTSDKMDTSLVSDADGDADADPDVEVDVDVSAGADVSAGVSNLTVNGEADADGDADAEMQDNFMDQSMKQMPKTPMVPSQQQGSLDVPRTRAHQPRANGVIKEGRFPMANGARPQAMNMRAMQAMGVSMAQNPMVSANNVLASMSEEMFMN
ncbi:hypothetical protein TD95_001504 [Thielaviopsis punctulata]|uniref:Uncharacterized protein n=1 Tax=Thielaviopsis punctulata TaxID=72032 RepID=A0A0F4ZIK4_9PEZI|nr:hypothetical protein TD95_001504 [Thielaviopsis punctulata]